MVIAALVVAAAGFVWLYCGCERQARQIDAMSVEVEQLRRDSEYWPVVVRAELLRMEMRLRALHIGNGIGITAAILMPQLKRQARSFRRRQ